MANEFTTIRNWPFGYGKNGYRLTRKALKPMLRTQGKPQKFLFYRPSHQAKRKETYYVNMAIYSPCRKPGGYGPKAIGVDE
jgi:hypothetical protein